MAGGLTQARHSMTPSRKGMGSCLAPQERPNSWPWSGQDLAVFPDPHRARRRTGRCSSYRRADIGPAPARGRLVGSITAGRAAAAAEPTVDGWQVRRTGADLSEASLEVRRQGCSRTRLGRWIRELPILPVLAGSSVRARAMLVPGPCSSGEGKAGSFTTAGR